MTEIKICGIQTPEDIRLLQRYRIEYAGFVMFYPRSKRNHDEKTVQPLLRTIDGQIHKVAVVVSPDMEMVKRLEQMGFDILQVHGGLKEEVLLKSSLRLWRAFHMEGKGDTISLHENMEAYVLDGKVPGMGEVFDWNAVQKIDRAGKKLVLAGGLHAQNVQEGIRKLRPDIVDVSSGVERTDGAGKDEERLRAFVEAVRETKGQNVR